MSVGDERHLQPARSGDAVRGALVTQPSQHGGIGPDEHDPQPLASFRGLSLLGGRSAAEAQGIRTACLQGTFEPAARQADGLVGLPDVQRVTLGLGVQGDHAERNRPTVAQLPRGMDGAHRRLAAACDGEPAEITPDHRRAARPSGPARVADHEQLDHFLDHRDARVGADARVHERGPGEIGERLLELLA